MTKLDRYESALLTELRKHVAERQATHAGRRRMWRRLAYAGVAAAAVAGISVVALPSGPTATPAFAVTEDSGLVHVSVTDVVDPNAVEAALADHGITAEIDFLPAGQMCGPREYDEAPNSLSMGTNDGGRLAEKAATKEGPWPWVSVTNGDGQIGFDLPADLTEGGLTWWSRSPSPTCGPTTTEPPMWSLGSPRGRSRRAPRSRSPRPGRLGSWATAAALHGASAQVTRQTWR